MVLQDTWLFAGTIRDNILYGRPEATEEEMVAAASAAYVDRFVHALPDGYDTLLDDEATNLSVGERQLVTIARAFLADPRLLILDEATSSVDTRTEVLIQESLEPPKLSADGCEVVAGRWYDPYTDTTFTDPRDLDVDHRVPLGEAHRSGGDRWDRARRQAYANDLSHPDSLIAVDRSANRSKADGDPLSWMPPAWGYRCAYVERWRDSKRRWDLAEDRLEGWWNDAVLWTCRQIAG